MAEQNNQQILSAIFNTVGWEKYKTVMKDANKTVDSYTRNIETNGRKMKETMQITKQAGQKDMYAYNKSVVSANKGTNDFVKALKRVAVVLPVWAATRALIQGVTRLIGHSIGFLKDFETQMAKVKLVGQSTGTEFSVFETKLLSLSKAYGTTAKELGEAAILWRQQGKSLQEVIPLMETTIQLSMITGRTMGESVEDLTSITKNFNISAQSSGVIVDKLTNVMLNHAITTDVMVQALKEAAPIATQFGVSLDKLIGIITATYVTTRAKGSRIGQAWNTIFSRMATVAKDAVQDIAKVPLFVDETGKAVFRNTGNFRNFGDAIDELAISYDKLGTVEKAQLGRELGGVRRIQFLTAAFQNWKEGIDATINSLDSYGTRFKSTGILLDTVESKQKQLTAAWNEFIATMITGTGSIKNALDTLKEWIEVSSDVVASWRGWSFADLGLEVIELDKAMGKINKRFDEQIGKMNATKDATEKYIDLLDTRNRREKSSSQADKDIVKDIENIIETYQKVLSKDIRFEGIFNLPLEEQRVKVKGVLDKLKEDLIKSQARQELIQENQKITDDVVVLWQDMFFKIETALGRTQVAEKFRKEMGSVLDLIGNDSDAAIKKLEELKKQFDDLSTGKFTKSFGVFAERTKLSKEELDNANKLKDSLDDIIAKLKTKKELNKEELNTIENAIKNRKLMEELLEEERVLTEQRSKLTEEIIKHELDLMQMRGASSVQLKATEIALYNIFDVERSIVDKAKDRLELEKEIQREQQNTLKLSNESLKIYDVYRVFGKDIAKQVADFMTNPTLKGLEEIKNKAPEAFKAIRLAFPDISKMMEPGQFFFGSDLFSGRDIGKGIDIPIKERTLLTQQLEAKLQQDIAVKFDVDVKADGNFVDNVINAILAKLKRADSPLSIKLNEMINKNIEEF